MEISTPYVDHSWDGHEFHAHSLQTSIVMDKDWNPLLQDFRLSKVLVTHGIGTGPLLMFHLDSLRRVRSDRSNAHD